MRENICKWCDQQEVNIQDTRTIHTTHYQKKKKIPIQWKKWAEDLNGHFSKEGIQMVNRHRKNAQHHLSLEKCKLRPQWSITSHLPEWFLSKRTLITNVGKNAEKEESSYTAGENVNLCSHCGKQLCRFPKNLKLELPYDSVIPLLGRYIKKKPRLIWTDTCSPMFTAAFTIAKIWKQHWWLSTDE